MFIYYIVFTFVYIHFLLIIHGLSPTTFEKSHMSCTVAVDCRFMCNMRIWKLLAGNSSYHQAVKLQELAFDNTIDHL